MSHECPDCYELCFCNGDIDDCMLNSDDAVNHCEHYKQCEKDFSEDWDFEDEPIELERDKE